jgi:hypothetical protein
MYTIKNPAIDILVFKTNIIHEDDVQKITSFMTEEKRVKKWNVDRMDIDNVLRIESQNLNPDEVIQLINNAGYFCEELTD